MSGLVAEAELVFHASGIGGGMSGDRIREAIHEIKSKAWTEGAVSMQKPLQEGQSLAGRLAVQSVVAAQVKFNNPYRERR